MDLRALMARFIVCSKYKALKGNRWPFIRLFTIGFAHEVVELHT